MFWGNPGVLYQPTYFVGLKSCPKQSMCLFDKMYIRQNLIGCH